jgi:LmbE family N-acetylglucosaminyl deacetylase
MSRSIAVIAAHPDDEILGCGGSIARWIEEGYEVNLLLIADGETSRSSANKKNIGNKLETRNSSAQACSDFLGCKSLTQFAFPDNSTSDVHLLEVIKVIEDFIKDTCPSKVVTHHSGDVNIDHRTIHDAVLAACRPQPGNQIKQLLFFEVPSSSEWNTSASRLNFFPNFYVDISNTLDKKIQALGFYSEEMRPYPHARSIKAITALAQWRGSTIGVEAAEAFMIGRIIE